MSKKGFNFTFLRKKMSDEDFKRYCQKISKLYANSENQFSYSYFVKEEGITKACFYRILKEAVVCNLVSEREVDKMEAKSLANQKRHHEKAGKSTIDNYTKLREKRNKYILDSYSQDDTRLLADEFAKRTDLSKEQFAQKYDVSIFVLDRLLKRAFTENIASDETCRKIEERSLEKNSSLKTKKFFSEIWKERKTNKQNN